MDVGFEEKQTRPYSTVVNALELLRFLLKQLPLYNLRPKPNDWIYAIARGQEERGENAPRAGRGKQSTDITNLTLSQEMILDKFNEECPTNENEDFFKHELMKKLQSSKEFFQYKTIMQLIYLLDPKWVIQWINSLPIETALKCLKEMLSCEKNKMVALAIATNQFDFSVN